MEIRYYRDVPMPEYVLGVDESGTGAFAGPFTVAAYLSTYLDTAHLVRVGARDSKKLSHEKRVLVADELLTYSHLVALEKVAHDYTDQRQEWRSAIVRAVGRCLKVIHNDARNAKVFIDGNVDARLHNMLYQRLDVLPIFLVHGEDRCPQIAAASIFAKTWRSELMNEAHALYPMYGWGSANGHGNDGYHTADHMKAIEEHGVCDLHRRVKPLVPFFEKREADAKAKVAAEHSTCVPKRGAPLRAPQPGRARSWLVGLR